MIKVLIFGGGSLLGQSLKKYKNFKSILVNTKTKKKNCNYFLKNIENNNEINKIFYKVKPSIVVFLSTIYKRNFVIEDKNVVKKINYDFGKKIYYFSKKYGVTKFFYTSTILELETKNKNNFDYYVKFKKKLSNFLINDKKSKIQNNIIYVPDTYSENDNRDRFIPNLISDLKNNRRLVLYQDQNELNLIHIDNLSNELGKMFLKEKKSKKHNRILILPKKSLNTQKVIEIILKKTKRKNILINKINKKKIFDFRSIKVLKINDNFEKWFKKKI